MTQGSQLLAATGLIALAELTRPAPPRAAFPASVGAPAGSAHASILPSPTPASSAVAPPTPDAILVAASSAAAAAQALPAQETGGGGTPPQARPTVAAHGYTWTARAVPAPVGGPVPRQAWSVRTLSGEVIHEEGDTVGPGVSRGPYDYFMATFPVDQLVRMVHLTSAKPRARGMQATTAGEVLEFLGVVILGTRYEFGARADLCVTKPRSKYLLAPAFGERTGLPRNRFDALWSCATCSAESAEGDATEKGR